MTTLLLVTHVRVTLPIGEASFPRAWAAVSPDQIVTVRWQDDDGFARLFRPEEWKELDVRDVEGHLIRHVVNGTQEKRPRVTAA